MYKVLLQLQDYYLQINFNNLSPNHTNNRTFSRSVNLILDNQNDISTKNKDRFEHLFDNFPFTANQAEFELECSCQKFQNYPYLQNYKELVKYEVESLVSLNTTGFRNILFIGSGPLPISSHYYSHYFSTASITNLDKSLVAIEMAKLHFPETNYALAEIENLTTEYLATFDLVIVAAGVGNSIADKAQIIHDLLSKKSNKTTFLLRDSPNLSSLLYFPVPPITSHQVHDFANSKPKTIINSCKIIL